MRKAFFLLGALFFFTAGKTTGSGDAKVSRDEQYIYSILRMEAPPFCSDPDRLSELAGSTEIYYSHYFFALRSLIEQDPELIHSFTKGERDRISIYRDRAGNDPLKELRLGAMSLESAFVYLSAGEEMAALIRLYRAFGWFAEAVPMPSEPGYLLLRASLGFIAGNLPPAANILFPPAGGIKDWEEDLELAAALCVPGSAQEAEVFSYHALFLLMNDRPADAGDVLGGIAGKYCLPDLLYLLVLKKTAGNDALLDFAEHWQHSWNTPWLSYLRGEACLKKLDPLAGIYLTGFLEEYKGPHYRKSAMLRLSWLHYLEGDTGKSSELACRIGEEGAELTEADRQALSESRRTDTWHPCLLRARLLFDGGYYEASLNELERIGGAGHLPGENQKLEYFYRLGRTLQELGEYKTALSSFSQAIRMGRDTPFYYAAYAAWNAGKIEEARGRYAEARRFYSLCIDIKPLEYRNSIHRKAKRSLENLSE